METQSHPGPSVPPSHRQGTDPAGVCSETLGVCPVSLSGKYPEKATRALFSTRMLYASADTWQCLQTFWLSQLGGGCFWHPVGRGQGCW